MVGSAYWGILSRLNQGPDPSRSLKRLSVLKLIIEAYPTYPFDQGVPFFGRRMCQFEDKAGLRRKDKLESEESTSELQAIGINENG